MSGRLESDYRVKGLWLNERLQAVGYPVVKYRLNAKILYGNIMLFINHDMCCFRMRFGSSGPFHFIQNELHTLIAAMMKKNNEYNGLIT